MKRRLFALIACLTCVSPAAFPQERTDNDTPKLTAQESTQLKAGAAAARAEWARLTPEQRASVKHASKQKRFAELSALEMYADNDTGDMSPTEAAALRAESAEARAKWATLSPTEKAAMRKQSRQMKLSEMNSLQKIAGSGS